MQTAAACHCVFSLLSDFAVCSISVLHLFTTSSSTFLTQSLLPKSPSNEADAHVLFGETENAHKRFAALAVVAARSKSRWGSKEVVRGSGVAFRSFVTKLWYGCEAPDDLSLSSYLTMLSEGGILSLEVLQLRNARGCTWSYSRAGCVLMQESATWWLLHLITAFCSWSVPNWFVSFGPSLVKFVW